MIDQAGIQGASWQGCARGLCQSVISSSQGEKPSGVGKGRMPVVTPLTSERRKSSNGLGPGDFNPQGTQACTEVYTEDDEVENDSGRGGGC